MPSVPRALIDLGAIRHNLGVARHHARTSRIWAVIKADGYGHGMGAVADALSDADGFAVARVDEGLALHARGVRKPILVLEGPMDARDLREAVAAGLELALHQPWQIRLLAELRPPRRATRVWLKLDTGMHRLGIPAGAAMALYERLRGLGDGIEIAGLMTHLANADDPADPLTEHQCRQARDVAHRLGLTPCIGNSAGIIAHPGARSDWVRPGIMLYGGSPLIGRAAAELDLRPAMTLSSRLIAVQQRQAGDAIGYGGTYRCADSMPVGVVAIGYGDGYPRHAPSGTPTLIRGRRAPLVGRVSMDMISVDLRGIPAAGVGDPVVLWGQGLPVETVAERVGTINYELVCRIAPRVVVEHRDDAAASPAA